MSWNITPRLKADAIMRPDSPIRWIRPSTNMYGETTIGYYGGWAVKITAMIFNDRLVLSDESPLGGPRYGWCFPKGGAAHLAAAVWDPETEGEPAGYIAAKPGGRAPGERAPWWHPPMA